MIMQHLCKFLGQNQSIPLSWMSTLDQSQACIALAHENA